MHWEFTEELEKAREAEEVNPGIGDGGVRGCGQQEILRHLGRVCRMTLQTRCWFHMRGGQNIQGRPNEEGLSLSVVLRAQGGHKGEKGWTFSLSLS